MNISLFIFVTIFLQVLCFWVGSRAVRGIKNQNDYFLSGRQVALFPLAMTLIATQLGGGTILGSAEEAFRLGWGVILFPLGYAIGFLVLALGVGRRMAQFPVTTIAQLFEVVYGSSVLKRVASLLSIVSLFLVLITQVIAMKKFMVSVGVSSEILFILFWGIVIVYTSLGGFKAVVATDVLQALFFIVMFFLAFGLAIWGNPDVIPDVVENLSSSFGDVPVIGWLLMPILFMVLSQDMGQRCFSARSGGVVAGASAIAAVCMVMVCIVPIFFGLVGQRMGIVVEEGGSVLLRVIERMTSPSVTACVAAGLLAAVISTADSLLNAIVSNIGQDFSWMRGRSIGWFRGVTFLLGLLALLFSYGFTQIVGLMVLSYEISVSCLFVPVFFALFTTRRDSRSAIGAMAFGLAGFFLFRFVAIPFPKEVGALIFSMAGYGLGMFGRVGEKVVRVG